MGEAAAADAIYYDPFDFEIDKDPYPMWKRMRDEQPLYFNDRYGFYALSRFDDVQAGLKDHKHHISSKGTLIEVIKSGLELPKGMVIFEDPPSHDPVPQLGGRPRPCGASTHVHRARVGAPSRTVRLNPRRRPSRNHH